MKIDYIHTSINRAPEGLPALQRLKLAMGWGPSSAACACATVRALHNVAKSIVFCAPAMAASIPRYNEGLDAARLAEVVGDRPLAGMHGVEWVKVVAGDPVEINPSVGSGFRVMSVAEWVARWKQNPDFPTCLACGSQDTREHFFTQTWCRGARSWCSEAVCLACHKFSHRSYTDPGFKSPMQWEKVQWEDATREQMASLSLAAYTRRVAQA